MVKTYIGVRKALRAVVRVQANARTRNLRHIPYHSPDGFEWGYQGSGPADLALAILVDHLKERPPKEGYHNKKFSQWTVTSKAWKFHQDFKREFVAQWSEGWLLHDQEIAAWLKEQEVKCENNGSTTAAVDLPKPH